MSGVLRRTIGAALLLVLGGTPLAAAACTWRCVSPAAATGAADSHHCHDQAASSGPAITATTPGACPIHESGSSAARVTTPATGLSAFAQLAAELPEVLAGLAVVRPTGAVDSPAPAIPPPRLPVSLPLRI